MGQRIEFRPRGAAKGDAALLGQFDDLAGLVGVQAVAQQDDLKAALAGQQRRRDRNATFEYFE